MTKGGPIMAMLLEFGRQWLEEYRHLIIRINSILADKKRIVSDDKLLLLKHILSLELYYYR